MLSLLLSVNGICFTIISLITKREAQFFRTKQITKKKMRQFCAFSSGLELANLVVNSELLHHSWNAISDLRKRSCTNDPVLPLPISYQVHEYPSIGTIIAFASPPSRIVQQLQRDGADLVSSDELAGSFSLFNFVCTKLNPSFSIHRAAVTLFFSNVDALSLLKEKEATKLTVLWTQHGSSRTLIVTGDSMGGSVASLFALWLLDGIPTKAKQRPFCVTFGSPLLGDSNFQKAISERSTWSSRFLHIVSYQDPILKAYTSVCSDFTNGSISRSGYMPFGTFMFCSESDTACFEEPESVMELMFAMSTAIDEDQGQNKNLQSVDYGLILEHLKHNNAIRKGHSPLDQSIANPLQAGIMIQLEAIGIKGLQGQRGNNSTTSLVANVGKRMEDFLIRKKNVIDPKKKLNDRKIDMTYLEWYKKVTVDQGGYYDSYKLWRWRSRDEIESRQEIMKRKRILTQYWKGMVDAACQMPQKDGVAFRTAWLYSGTTYRRMIEPLDIAEYYGNGKKDYLTRARARHYILLEEWLNDEKQPRTGNTNSRNKSCSLTEDSCFWAHVEEAVICCKVLKDDQSNQEDKESSRISLVEFEEYVMDLINNYSVSFEVFLDQSSFMQWWRDYSEIIFLVSGSSYHSPLTDFMKNQCYKNYV